VIVCMVVKALCPYGAEAGNADPVARALVAAKADALPGSIWPQQHFMHPH
jgi:hypothetical protein